MTTATTTTTNLRNRIEASKKAPGYNERCFVDAPTHELDAMLVDIDKLRHALENTTRTLQIILNSPYCVTANLAALQRQVDGAQATLKATK
jgi:hypothetical protein